MNKPVPLSFLALTLMGCAAAAHADDTPAVTPYRPSVSTPAALVASAASDLKWTALLR